MGGVLFQLYLQSLKRLSDPIDEVYEKYLSPHPEPGAEDKVRCPKCGSENVDRKAGYRGEYRCMTCGYSWQVGGWQAT
jgi:DNA-directed RNA polymerase subunit RPC12/RpoP